ncbi:positive regulation of fibroblast apoptotic process [Paramarasmius palmivorus]|uniref:Positive regulation of fibroblast apoptotic process n=1 Tax=Paramarasmius palmivorus TaxID=297713 RepID=A0AAW0DEE4_9AGAR
MFGIFQMLFIAFNFTRYVADIHCTLGDDKFRMRLKEISLSHKREEEDLWPEDKVSCQDNEQETIQADDMVELLLVLAKRGVQVSSEDTVSDLTKAQQLPSHLLTGRNKKGEVVAIKFTKYRGEVDIHMMLKKIITPCPYIIPLLDYVGPVSDYYLLVTPFCTPLPELDNTVVADYAVVLMSQLLMGTEFLHKNCVAHLDIRPDNLVVYLEGQQPCLKMIDFGLSVYVEGPTTQLYGFRGFLPWVSPEVRNGGAFLPFAADAWAYADKSFCNIKTIVSVKRESGLLSCRRSSLLRKSWKECPSWRMQRRGSLPFIEPP